LLSLLPFIDQLLFWAPQISHHLWNPSAWAIPTQIRMVLGLFAMYAFDTVPSPWYSSLPKVRIGLALIFHLVSIGVKGLLVTIGWYGLAALFSYYVLRKYYDDEIVVLGGMFVIPFVPGLYFAPLQILLGYGLFTVLALTLGTTKNQDQRGSLCMRTSLPLAIGVLVWTYVAAFTSSH
jgi:hypothetical protein